MSDVLNQIKQKIETTVKSGIETVEHLVGIGKTTAAKAVAAAEAAVAQATTQVEASAAATLAAGATGALPGATVPPAPPVGDGLGSGPSGPQPPSASAN